MTVAEIEAAIIQLSTPDVAALIAWLANYHGRVWDQQIEDDLEAGRLDALLAEVEKEYQAGLARSL